MATNINISSGFLHRVIMANGLQLTVCLKCGREIAASPHLLGLEAAEKAHQCGEWDPNAPKWMEQRGNLKEID